MKGQPWVIGYSLSHNGSVCLLHGDEIVAAIQEERLTRQKRATLPGLLDSCALRYCLSTAGITLDDVDVIVGATVGHEGGIWRPTMELGDRYRGTSKIIPHYLAHAYAAFATSGFADAVVLVVDGGGEALRVLQEHHPHELEGAKHCVLPERPDPISRQEVIGIYRASGTEVVLLEKHIGSFLFDYKQGVPMPSYGSLGAMFSAGAVKIFNEILEAGKVMGLAPYGEPVIPADDFFTIRSDGTFEFKDRVPKAYADYPGLWPAHDKEHRDLACSMQVALEGAIDYLGERCAALGRSDHLVYAGGVALNSVANEKLIQKRFFQRHYIMPAAEDSGIAIGAAYYGLWHATGTNTRRRLHHDAVGRAYTAAEIDEAIAAAPFVRRRAGADPLDAAVDALCDGKIIGWFQGRSELGPRALGQRSILCDPRRPDGKDVLNARIKHREGFRPFAPAILEQEVHAWFRTAEHEADSPFMLRVFDFREEVKAKVPAVVHVDGTGRVQTVNRANNGRYYDLIERFHARTGVPIILNTSFNVMNEPIVETPTDALWCLLFSGLDLVVLGDTVLSIREGFPSPLDLPMTLRIDPSSFARVTGRAGDQRAVVQSTCPWGARMMELSADGVRLAGELQRGPQSGRALLPTLRDGEAPWKEIRMMRALASLQRAGVISFVMDDAAG